MLTGSFPDLLEIDAASHNSVDNIRDLVEKVQYTPQRGRYKVYIIDEVHMVTKQGFNALLKTLEEPPPHVIFILATTDPQQLLDTVVSRCQRFDFKMIPVRTIYERLKFVAEQEGVQVPDASLKVIAREGGGSMRDAQSLLDQVLSFSGEAVSEQEVAEILGFIDRSILYGILESTLSADPAGALITLSKVAVYGYDVRTFANQLLEAVRNVALVVQVPDAGKLLDLPDDEIAKLGVLAKDRDSSLLSQQFDILAATVDSIARSEQPMLLLEMAAVKMASVRPLVPVAAMLNRLEALERKLRRGGAGGGNGSSGSSRGGQPSRHQDPAPSGYRSSPEQSQARVEQPPSRQPATSAVPVSQEPTPAAPASAPAHPMNESVEAIQQADSVVVHDSTAIPDPATPVVASGDVLDSLFNYRRGASPTAEAAKPPAASSVAPASPPVTSPMPPLSTPDVAQADTQPISTTAVSDVRPTPTPTPVNEPANHSNPDAEDVLCDAKGWRRFVHSLEGTERLAPLQALLATSGLLSCEGRKLKLGFDSEATLQQAERLIDEDAFVDRANQYFGCIIELGFILDKDGERDRTLSEELERIRTEHHQRLELAARQHPAVSRSLDTFPGAVIDAVRVPALKEINDVQ
jgi:DNA polymerase-3 subunit gamma/tau